MGYDGLSQTPSHYPFRIPHKNKHLERTAKNGDVTDIVSEAVTRKKRGFFTFITNE